MIAIDIFEGLSEKMRINEAGPVQVGLIAGVWVAEFPAMKGRLHVVDVVSEVVELGRVGFLGIMHVERHPFNCGGPWTAVGPFVLLENIASADFIPIGGQGSETFDIHPFLVAFDLETLADLPEREQLEDAGLDSGS